MGVLRREVKRNLARTQKDLFSELQATIDETFGVNDSWVEIKLFDALFRIFFRCANRVMVGYPLCRNETYLQAEINYVNWVVGSAIIIGQFLPYAFRRVGGYLVKMILWVYKTRCLKFLLPLVKERMENTRRKHIDPSFDYDAPDDLITWVVEALLTKTKSPTPELVAERVLILVGYYSCNDFFLGITDIT
jgi:hypothetical protein